MTDAFLMWPFITPVVTIFLEGCQRSKLRSIAVTIFDNCNYCFIKEAIVNWMHTKLYSILSLEEVNLSRYLRQPAGIVFRKPCGMGKNYLITASSVTHGYIRKKILCLNIITMFLILHWRSLNKDSSGIKPEILENQHCVRKYLGFTPQLVLIRSPWTSVLFVPEEAILTWLA